VTQLIQEYPIKVVCEVLDYPRSQLYYEATPATDDPRLEAEITVTLAVSAKQRAGVHPTYGYRRITAELFNYDVGGFGLSNSL
jgi:putative transposase